MKSSTIAPGRAGVGWTNCGACVPPAVAGVAAGHAGTPTLEAVAWELGA